MGRAMTIYTERLPPQSQDTEEALLGALLLDGDAVGAVRGIVRPQDFAHERNAWLYEAALALAEKGVVVDQVTLADELERVGRLEGAGGRAYLAHLASVCPTSVHAAHYARTLRGMADKRGLIRVAGKIAELGYSPASPEEAQQAALDALLGQAVWTSRQTRFGPADLAKGLAEDMARLAVAPNEDLLPTGFRDLDRAIGGLFKGDYTVLAARTTMGKSELAWDIARGMVNAGLSLLWVSTEMSRFQIQAREVARVSGVPLATILRGGFGDSLAVAADQVTGWFNDNAIRVLADAPRTTADVAAELRLMRAGRPADVVVLDYLQQLRDDYGDGDVERLGYISGRIKALAQEEHVAVLAVAQINRAPLATGSKVPTMGDIRGCGIIEQDASTILLMHRPDYYVDYGSDGRPKAPVRSGECDIHIPKLRHGGQTGVVTLVWLAKGQRYADAVRREVQKEA